MARINVVLDDALLKELRSLVPLRQRNGFIVEAVRARLTQLRQIRAAEAAAGAWSSEGRKDPSQEIEEGRRTLADFFADSPLRESGLDIERPQDGPAIPPSPAHLPSSRLALRTMMCHHRIMRTTVDIPEHLLIEAKQLAAERHLPLTRLFEDSLRLYLGEQRLRRAQAAPSPLPILQAPVPVEDVDLDDTSRLWELA